MQRSSTSQQFMTGLNATWQGLGMALGSSRLRRSYLRLTIAIATIALVIDAIGVYALWQWTSELVFDSSSKSSSSWFSAVCMYLSLDAVGQWIVRILGIVLLFLLAPIIAFFIVNFIFPFFNDAVFLAGMEVVAPKRGMELATQPGRGIAAGFTGSLRRLIIFVAWSAIALAIGFIPVIGPPSAAILQFYCTARATVWELLDPYFDRCNLSFSQQRRFLRSRRMITLAFGGPWTMVLATPLIGPAFFGVAQAATAKLVWEMEQMFGNNELPTITESRS